MRRLLTRLAELIVMWGIFAVCDMPGILKYVAVALASVVLLFLGKKKLWVPEALICVALPVIVYLGIGCMNSLLHANIYTSTAKIVLFWTVPLLFAFSLYVFYGENMSRIIDIQFAASALVYLITKGRFILETITVESMFSYVYGIFFVYYVYKKRWACCVIAIALMFLTDKRIVFAAAAVAVMVQVFLWLFRNDKRIALGVWGVVALIANGYLWLVCSGTLEAFCKGVGINTNGRVKVYGKVVEWFGTKSLVVGNGLGIVESVLSAWNIEKFSNLHNDLLKFCIELGFLGLILYFISYGIVFYFVGKKFSGRAMNLFVSAAMYTMILFATDNVSIYIIFLVPLYSIYFAILSAMEIEVINDKKGNS